MSLNEQLELSRYDVSVSYVYIVARADRNSCRVEWNIDCLFDSQTFTCIHMHCFYFSNDDYKLAHYKGISCKYDQLALNNIFDIFWMCTRLFPSYVVTYLWVCRCAMFFVGFRVTTNPITLRITFCRTTLFRFWTDNSRHPEIRIHSLTRRIIYHTTTKTSQRQHTQNVTEALAATVKVKPIVNVYWGALRLTVSPKSVRSTDCERRCKYHQYLLN